MLDRHVVELPLAGRIAAGRPVEAVEDKEMISLADFARGHQLEYLLLTPDDYYRDLNARGTHGLTEAMQSAAFQKQYELNRVAVYKLRMPDTSARLHPGLE